MARKRELSRESSDAADDSRDVREARKAHESPPSKRKKLEPKTANVLRPGVPTPVDLYSFEAPDRHSPPSRGVDKNGHFCYELGDNLGSRYKILSQMGEGTFGRVLECWDRKHKEVVAVKVIRNVRKYREAAMIELEVLNTLAANDADDAFHCVRLRLWFEYRGHVCMVFSKLGSSLYDFLRRNGYRPFPLDVVSHFARQILQAVAFMHRLAIVHTDLKPENVLLCENKYVKVEHGRGSRLGRRVPVASDLKVIDLGSATFEDQYHSTIVSTRHYRAPEVILGVGWSYPCDVWSVGCIIVELLTGKALFQTHDNLEHLAMIERVVGAVPRTMAASATRETAVFFSSKHTLLWPDKSVSRRSIRNVKRLDTLKRMLRQEGDASIQAHLDSLHDLLENMIRIEPGRRLSAADCLQHHFFRENIRPCLALPDAARDGVSTRERDGDASGAEAAPRSASEDTDKGARSELGRRSAAPSNPPLCPIAAADRAVSPRSGERAPKIRRQDSPIDIVVSAAQTGVIKPMWAGSDLLPGRRQAAVS